MEVRQVLQTKYEGSRRVKVKGGGGGIGRVKGEGEGIAGAGRNWSGEWTTSGTES